MLTLTKNYAVKTGQPRIEPQSYDYYRMRIDRMGFVIPSTGK